MESKKHMTGLQNKLSPEIKNKINYNNDMAEWQSGHAADCNSVNMGSIHFSASIQS